MFKVTFVEVAPRGVSFKYAEMNRTEAANTLPGLVDDYLPGEIKSTVNRWDKEGKHAVVVVQFVDANGQPVLNKLSSADNAKVVAKLSPFFKDPTIGAKVQAIAKHNPNGTRKASISAFSQFIDLQDPEMFEVFIEKHPFRKDILAAVSH